ncbi:pyridoxamine 5'-phosphate oxidase family protein [Kineococcus sp. TBRC 1896]|uniref:Pyridoxamine 5'-phosphate oxidase family protein n=1 Tax=Kineococcus mangrovi TaxID=1660183 RepID=A0ABV4I2F6_9ACTN
MSAVPVPPDPQRLDAGRCRHLLGPGGVGRVVFTAGSLPAVATTNYAVHGGRLWFRTAAGTALARSVTNAVVAVNVDASGPASGEAGALADGGGWTVTVTGRCRALDDPPEAVRGALDAWAPGVREQFFCVDLALLSGQRTPARAPAPPF